MAEQLIRLHAYEPSIVTAEEYEGLQRELMTRHVAGDLTLGDRILAKILVHNYGRYHQIKGRHLENSNPHLDVSQPE